MINTSPLLSAALQQELKKNPLCANGSIYIFAVWAKPKIIQLYVRDVLQNFLQSKNYFLRSSLCPFHCPSGSLPAAPWLTLRYSATSVVGAAANWYRRLFFSALVCRIARPQSGLTYLHWFTFMGFSQNAMDLYCWGEEQNLTLQVRSAGIASGP